MADVKPDLENSGVSGSRRAAATSQQPRRLIKRTPTWKRLAAILDHFLISYDSTFVQKCDFSMWSFVVAVFFKKKNKKTCIACTSLPMSGCVCMSSVPAKRR